MRSAYVHARARPLFHGDRLCLLRPKMWVLFGPLSVLNGVILVSVCQEGIMKRSLGLGLVPDFLVRTRTVLQCDSISAVPFLESLRFCCRDAVSCKARRRNALETVAVVDKSILAPPVEKQHNTGAWPTSGSALWERLVRMQACRCAGWLAVELKARLTAVSDELELPEFAAVTISKYLFVSRCLTWTKIRLRASSMEIFFRRDSSKRISSPFLLFKARWVLHIAFASNFLKSAGAR